MSSPNDLVDDRLCEAWSSLLSQYQATARKLEAMVSQLDSARSASRVNEELRVILMAVEQQQGNYEQAIRLWNTEGYVRSARCVQLKEEVQQTLESLIGQIRNFEANAQQQKSRLLPQLNSAALDQQACAAYQRVNKNS